MDKNESMPLVDLEEEFKAPLLEKSIGDRENQERKYDKAIQHYLQALNKLKELFDARTNELAKDFSKAKKLIETVGIPCHLNLSHCYLKLGHWKKCIYECDKVLQMDKSNSKAIFRRSTANAEMNDFVKAKEDYQIIKGMLPRSPEVEVLRKMIEEKEESCRKRSAAKGGLIKRLVTYAINNPVVDLAIEVGIRKPKSVCSKATQMIAATVQTVKYVSIDYPLSLIAASLQKVCQLKDKFFAKAEDKKA